MTGPQASMPACVKNPGIGYLKKVLKFTMRTINIVSTVLMGDQGQKSCKHNFEITGDPKGSPNGSNLRWGFEVTDPYGHLWGHTLFRPQQGPKYRKWQLRPKTRILYNHSIDKSLLTKKRMPYMELLVFLINKKNKMNFL